MLELSNVNFTLGNFSLRNISFKVEKGEILVILGLSGSGKTTLLNTILGIYKPTSGKIIYNNEDITKKPINKRNIAFVPQSLLLYPHMTVYENIEYGLKLQNIKKEEREKRINEILEFMQLETKKDYYPHMISGGEKQKVSIARAFVLRSPLILMDEPLTNIDLPKRSEILKLIKDLQKRFKKTIIYVTHQLAEASCLATKVAIMENGSIIRIGTVMELLHDPQKIFIAELLNFENIFPARILRKNGKTIAEIENNGKKVNIQLTGTYEADDVVTITIRPEDLMISTNPLESISARNCLKGQIKEIVENLEGTIKIRVDCGIMLTALITRTSFEELKLKKGSDVYLIFKATAVKIIE